MCSTASWIKGVVFDMDGTLFISPFDWEKIRENLGVKGGLILDHLNSLPPLKRREKFLLLEKMEREAVSRGKPAPGAGRVLKILKDKGLKLGVLTNNSRALAEKILSTFPVKFDALVTRDDGVWKPYPQAVKKILQGMDLSPQQTVYVGDNLLDIKAALPFPFAKILIINNSPQLLEEYRGRVRFLHGFGDILREIFPGEMVN